ncbi:MAG: DUF4292 domain-containing protein [Bacteroidetes bacterium]|nr:DUF4292 domain-containing protein [Bacteroidota bacterium]
MNNPKNKSGLWYKSLIRITGWIILLAVILPACKTSAPLVKGPLKEEGPDYLIRQMKAKEVNYSWFSAKFTAEYVKDKSLTSFSGQLRIRNDSVIWISITPALGIEAFRLVLTPDSVKFMNRMDNTYFIGTYQWVNNFLKTSMNFDVLESILLGNDVSWYENENFRASIDENQYKLSTSGRRKMKKTIKSQEAGPQILLQNLWLDPHTYKIIRTDIKELGKENVRIQANYSTFNSVNNMLIPGKILFDFSADNPFRISVDFSKIVLDSPQPMPFKVPSTYKQIR